MDETTPLDPETAKALARRRRHRERQKAYYDRNKARINELRRERYAREKALIEALEKSLEQDD